MHIPPFNITEKILHQISEISEQVGSLNSRIGNDVPSPMLRKKNQIRTIHSSLAIENNTLSLKQVTDIIDGKHVLGAPDEIQEVKNAIEAYRLMPQLDAFKEKDLLKAHGLMMSQLVRNAGHYRQEGVGVFEKDHITIESSCLLQASKARILSQTNSSMTDLSVSCYADNIILHPSYRAAITFQSTICQRAER